MDIQTLLVLNGKSIFPQICGYNSLPGIINVFNRANQATEKKSNILFFTFQKSRENSIQLSLSHCQRI